MELSRYISITFARGGSKGLPRKNLLKINKIPLLGHAINCALEIIPKQRVFVSTDDPEIAECAYEYGATVINRPSELASDESPEWKSWIHACETVAELGIEFDFLLSVPCTSPLRQSIDLKNCIEAFKESHQADACISITHAHRNPYFNMVKLLPDQLCTVAFESRQLISRRQDTPSLYDITTVAYAASKNFVLSSQGIFDGKVCYSFVPKERSLDIDDAYDFAVAKALMEKNITDG